jgi:hypothetical protein
MKMEYPGGCNINPHHRGINWTVLYYCKRAVTQVHYSEHTKLLQYICGDADSLLEGKTACHRHCTPLVFLRCIFLCLPLNAHGKTDWEPITTLHLRVFIPSVDNWRNTLFFRQNDSNTHKHYQIICKVILALERNKSTPKLKYQRIFYDSTL